MARRSCRSAVTSRRPCYYCKQPACLFHRRSVPSRLLHPALCSRSENTEATKRQRHPPPRLTHTHTQPTNNHLQQHLANQSYTRPIKKNERKKATLCSNCGNRYFPNVFISRSFVQPANAPSRSANNNNKLVAGWGGGVRTPRRYTTPG